MSGGHFTWLHNLPELLGVPVGYVSEAEKLGLAVLLGSTLILAGKVASSKIAASGERALIVPRSGFSMHNFFDFFVEAFVKFQDSVLGRENRQYLPLTGTIFIFLLLSNLIGLVPGVAAITTTVWVNVAIALSVFVYFNYEGIRKNGVIGYFKHFLGPIWWLAWLILPIELFSTCLRVVTLNMRLYWNISADHIVLDAFTNLTKLVVPVIFYGIGTFVCFIQALVFTILTMVYILLATQHEEEH